jgi:hypothetical protein
MDKDTRHALGNGSESETFRENELARPHPFEFGPNRPSKPEDMGTPNPAINKSRPIAQMHPNRGTGKLRSGIAWRTPMGEPYDD